MRQFEGYGPPELATGGKDGCLRVWDIRQPGTAVAAFEPAAADQVKCHLSMVPEMLSRVQRLIAMNFIAPNAHFSCGPSFLCRPSRIRRLQEASLPASCSESDLRSLISSSDLSQAFPGALTILCDGSIGGTKLMAVLSSSQPP